MERFQTQARHRPGSEIIEEREKDHQNRLGPLVNAEQKAKYGINALLFLAQREGNEPVPIPGLPTAKTSPPNFLKAYCWSEKPASWK